MLQKETPELCARLLELNYTVLMETGGSLDLSPVDKRVIKIIDLKCPGSGEEEKNYWPNLEFLQPRDQIKFVLKDRRDYEWACSTIREHHLDGRFHLLFSPVHGELDLQDLAKWMLGDGISARFQIQLHKYIWSPETRGV
jgi:7-carboxy-7-deazaguanine synthase